MYKDLSGTHEIVAYLHIIFNIANTRESATYSTVERSASLQARRLIHKSIYSVPAFNKLEIIITIFYHRYIKTTESLKHT